jgi:DNA-binding response OmpR family regulator
VQEGTGADRARATVLVVDDDADVRQLLEDILVSAGFEVVLADSGANLAEVVRQQHPNVVLLDQVMEPVSGVEALQALRASGQDVPVVMLTAIGRDDMVETALDTGADDYVTKPFSEAVLVAHLRVVLRRQRWRASYTNR